MSQNAVLTQGTQLLRGDGAAPEVFSNIPEIISISGPDATKAEIRVTDLGSTAEEFVGGLADFGRMSIEMYYRGTLLIHQQLFADFKNPTSPIRNFKLAFTNGKFWNFAASVFAFPMSIQPNETDKVTMTLRLSGTVTEV
jgi:hypothetical protein